MKLQLDYYYKNILLGEFHLWNFEGRTYAGLSANSSKFYNLESIDISRCYLTPELVALFAPKIWRSFPKLTSVSLAGTPDGPIDIGELVDAIASSNEVTRFQFVTRGEVEVTKLERLTNLIEELNIMVGDFGHDESSEIGDSIVKMLGTSTSLRSLTTSGINLRGKSLGSALKSNKALH